MKIVANHMLIENGPFASSPEWKALQKEVHTAIEAAEWPVGSGSFTIRRESGKKRGEGNGVTPVKAKTMEVLCGDRHYGRMGKAAKAASKKAEAAEMKSEKAAALAEQADDDKTRAKAEKARRAAELALELADAAAEQFSQENTGRWISEYPWPIGERVLPGNMDAAYSLPGGGLVAFEWETGNISSSHRSMNKMALGLHTGDLRAGILVVPSRKLYKFLTDRVGNVAELEPYFPLWKATPCENGVLEVVVIEHDAESDDVARC